MSVTKLASYEEYEDAKKAKDNLLVLDFCAEWCGPCKRLAPQLQKLAEEYTEVKFYKIDVEEHEKLVSEYKISSMPTIIFLQNGVIAEKVMGANLEAITKAIKAITEKVTTSS